MKIIRILACAATVSAIGLANFNYQLDFNYQLFSCGGVAGWACPGITILIEATPELKLSIFTNICDLTRKRCKHSITKCKKITNLVFI
jgi:hypothetical protein